MVSAAHVSPTSGSHRLHWENTLRVSDLKGVIPHDGRRRKCCLERPLQAHKRTCTHSGWSWLRYAPAFANIMIRDARCSVGSLVGVHGKHSILRLGPHGGSLQSHNGRTSSSATWGRNIRSVGRSVEDDRVLLATPSGRPFESVGSG